MMNHLHTFLADAEKKVAESGSPTPRLDAEVLLAHLLKVERINLYLSDDLNLNDETSSQFNEFIKRRCNHEPVAYITGDKEFWSMPVKVTKDVLIPRPETEILIERVLSMLDISSRDLHLLDLCTGSGNIPMALAKEISQAKIVATDISADALKVASTNTSFAKNRIDLRLGDLFEPLNSDEKFDLITANPPYGRPADAHLFSPEVIEHEPEMAVFGGTDGLDLISDIIKYSHKYLKADGCLVMEIGIGQAESVSQLFSDVDQYEDVNIEKDYAGIERIVSARYKWKS